MGPKSPTRVEILRGTLDLLILRTLLPGPGHGHAIAKHIQHTSEDLLKVDTGSLYPALYRLEANGWVAASWERAAALAVSLPIALGASRFLESFLFEVEPNDPMALVFAVGVLSSAALLAGYGPARKASRISPMAALRRE